MPYHDEEDFEFYNALHRLQPSVPPESGLGPRGNALSAVAEDPYVQEPWRGIGRRMEENVPEDAPWSGSVLGRAGSTFGKWASGRLPQAPSEIPSIPSGVFADQVPDFTRKMYPQDDSGQLLLTPGQAQLLTAQNVPGPQGVLNRLSAIAQHFDPVKGFAIGGLRRGDKAIRSLIPATARSGAMKKLTDLGLDPRRAEAVTERLSQLVAKKSDVLPGKIQGTPGLSGDRTRQVLLDEINNTIFDVLDEVIDASRTGTRVGRIPRPRGEFGQAEEPLMRKGLSVINEIIDSFQEITSKSIKRGKQKFPPSIPVSDQMRNLRETIEDPENLLGFFRDDI